MKKNLIKTLLLLSMLSCSQTTTMDLNKKIERRGPARTMSRPQMYENVPTVKNIITIKNDDTLPIEVRIRPDNNNNNQTEVICDWTTIAPNYTHSFDVNTKDTIRVSVKSIHKITTEAPVNCVFKGGQLINLIDQ